MSKEILYFMLPGCPHCVLAERYMDELMAEQPRYKEVRVRVVDESSNMPFAEQFDYYYVPSYYLGDVKLHEGHAEKDDVRRVLDAALAASL